MASPEQLLARNLMRHKRRRRIYATDIADAVGVSERQVYRWLGAAQMPSGENLKALAALFGVTVADLFADGKRGT